MSYFSQLFGAGGSVPLGAIVCGQFANDPKYLPCDGSEYLAASYPDLDKTQLVTHGANVPVAVTVPLGGAIPCGAAYGVAANGAGLYVVIGSNTATYATSPDGITWTSRTLPAVTNQYGYDRIAYGNGLFVLGITNNPSGVYTSPDGINWTLRSLPGVQPYGVSAALYVNGLWFLFRPTGQAQVANYFTSPEGITWTARGNPAGTATPITDIVYGDGRYLMCAGGGLYVSSDGISWNTVGRLRAVNLSDTNPSASIGNINSVAWFKGQWFMATSGYGLFTTRDFLTCYPLGLDGVQTVGSAYALRHSGGLLYIYRAGNSMVTTPDGQSIKLYSFASPPGPSVGSQNNGFPVHTPSGIFNYDSATANRCWMHAFDSSRFRTPIAARDAGLSGVNDAARAYIRAVI